MKHPKLPNLIPPFYFLAANARKLASSEAASEAAGVQGKSCQLCRLHRTAKITGDLLANIAFLFLKLAQMLCVQRYHSEN